MSVTQKVSAGSKALQAAVEGIDWEFADANTQSLTHNIHRYSGKFIPQVAAAAINLLTAPKETVLDPYCGSGTTLLECLLSGRHAVGIDLNPLAVLISRVKTRQLNTKKLRDFEARLIEKTWERINSIEGSLFAEKDQTLIFSETDDWRWNDEWYQKWFQPDVLRDFLFIDHLIKEETDKDIQDVGLLALSDILRKCSNAASGYPNVMFDKNAPSKKSPLLPFQKSIEDIFSSVVELSEKSGLEADVTVIEGSNIKMPLDSCSIDAVVTHPPYIGSIPYAEYGLLSLSWLGYNAKVLDKQLTGGQRQSRKVVERFCENYKEMISESYRVLKPGKYAFFMVGNPTVRGEVINLRDITCSFCQGAGFVLAAETRREGMNRRANKMGAEHLLFFFRP